MARGAHHHRRARAKATEERTWCDDEEASAAKEPACRAGRSAGVCGGREGARAQVNRGSESFSTDARILRGRGERGGGEGGRRQTGDAARESVG
jgi:hypothetical protein